MSEITVPGKIIFYGGYSVLEKGNISLSIAVVDEQNKGVTAKYEKGKRRIISPQFKIDITPSLENKVLIVYPYIVTEVYLKAKGKWKNDVKVKVTNSPIFGNKDEKTGLGSSAAATVSVVKALFEANGLNSEENIDTIHKLSQFSYALFSQKVGSGFDIATSSFGKTITYHRYNPQEIVLPPTNNAELLKAIIQSVEKPWGWIKAETFAFPSKYNVLFFNIKGAKTSTIGSVKAVIQFKAKNPAKYAEIINMQKEAEEKAIDALSKMNDTDIRKYTHEARDAHKLLQKETASLVPDFDPIEPEPLTRIIDESEKIAGVIAGRCPGAGGWDGLAFIVNKDFKDAKKIIEIGKKEGLKLEHILLKVL
ncbi:Phosphomevalonate kinase [uncultured archaeon]|nr:Phosphomevalonate kinase [uncultured archaeon]